MRKNDVFLVQIVTGGMLIGSSVGTGAHGVLAGDAGIMALAVAGLLIGGWSTAFGVCVTRRLIGEGQV